MRIISTVIIVISVALLAGAGWIAVRNAVASGSSSPLGTGFTYQGRLTDLGNPASGPYDLEFKVHKDSSLTSQTGSTVTKDDVQVTDGLFTVKLDFGQGVFTGRARWLEIGVRPGASAGAYTTLSPRTELSPAPYALALPGLFTIPNPTSTNVVGGFAGNRITSGVFGATIGGGGATTTENSVAGNFGTVSGGANNTSSGEYAAVGGGQLNVASGFNSVVAGGEFNSTGGLRATVGGGEANSAGGNGSTIGGGKTNASGGSYSTIGGGDGNTAGGSNSVISGGENNTAGGSDAASGGGEMNVANGSRATVAGGYHNTSTGSDSTVGGGQQNVASGSQSTVSGGRFNSSTAQYATVGGGRYNGASGTLSTVAGGDLNVASGDYAVVSGGRDNQAIAYYATISGGGGGSSGNDATDDYGTIGGGSDNLAGNKTGGTSDAAYATVGGGYYNKATSSYSTIPGGRDANATAYGQLAYASGRFSNAGDAQASLYVLRNTTNDATETELFLDGGSQRISVSDGRAMSFDILVVGRSSAGTVTLSHIVGIIENTGGTTRVPTAIVAQTYTDASGGATAVADDTNDALAVKVTGVAATNMRWVATVRTAEVSW